MGTIFWLITYYLLCAAIILGSDDGKPWKVTDHFAVIFAPICAPLYVGVCVGAWLRSKGVAFTTSATDGNAKAVEAFKQMCPFHDGRCRPNCEGCARLNQFIQKLNEE